MGLFDSVSVVMDAVDDSAEETDVVVTLKEKNWYALRIGSTTSVGAGDFLRSVGLVLPSRKLYNYIAPMGKDIEHRWHIAQSKVFLRLGLDLARLNRIASDVPDGVGEQLKRIKMPDLLH